MPVKPAKASPYLGLPYPIENLTVRKHLALKHHCPNCSGKLDQSWQCAACSYDAIGLIPEPVSHG